VTAELAARRLILIDRIVRLSPEKVPQVESALDEIETGVHSASSELRRLLRCADVATEAARASERAMLLAWERACNERDEAINSLEVLRTSLVEIVAIGRRLR
jgi:hypothetical protein